MKLTREKLYLAQRESERINVSTSYQRTLNVGIVILVAETPRYVIWKLVLC